MQSEMNVEELLIREAAGERIDFKATFLKLKIMGKEGQNPREQMVHFNISSDSQIYLKLGLGMEFEDKSLSDAIFVLPHHDFKTVLFRGTFTYKVARLSFCLISLSYHCSLKSISSGTFLLSPVYF